MSYQDLTGLKFGRWTVIDRVAGLSNSGHAKFNCTCDCGAVKPVLGYKLRRGESLSCGCHSKELSSIRATTHGLSRHRLFPIWNSMMSRCYNPKNEAYKDYGGRGICVCDRWHDVTNFISDNDRIAAAGLSIDRENNELGYSIDNCRWITAHEQSRNKRSNVLITFNGKTKVLFDWALEVGIAPRTLWARINSGRWSVEKALTTTASSSNKLSSMIDYEGRTWRIGELAEAHGLTRQILWSRINKYGWSIEKALAKKKRGQSDKI